jgi:hypothetical protein
MDQRMSPYILKIRFSNTSCLIEQKTWFDVSIVFNMTHLRIYGRKLISRHFQLARIAYQKLYFHSISRFSAVSIINVWRYNSGTACIQKVYLSILLTDPTKKINIISIGFFNNLLFVNLILTANFIILSWCLFEYIK